MLGRGGSGHRGLQSTCTSSFHNMPGTQQKQPTHRGRLHALW